MRALAIMAIALAMLAGCSDGGEGAFNASEDFTLDNLSADNGSAIAPTNTGNGDDNRSDADALAPADGLAYCDVIQDRVPVAECEHYREIWRGLEAGRGALDVPERLVVNEPATVSFALARPERPDRAGSVTDPSELLDSAPEKTGTVRVGRRMAARLTGEGFAIEPAELVEKDLAASGAARWDWRVTARRGGRQRLTLSTYVIVQPPGGPRAENLIRTLSQEVDVAVTAGQRARAVGDTTKEWLEYLTGWLGALAAFIGVGLFGVWIAIRKFRTRKEGSGEDEPPAPPDDDAG